MFGAVKNVNRKTGIRNNYAKLLVSVKKLFKYGKSVDIKRFKLENWCKTFQ